MKTIRLMLFATVVAAAALSCSKAEIKEEVQNPEGGNASQVRYTISAILPEEIESKVSVTPDANGPATLSWQENDQLNLVMESNPDVSFPFGIDNASISGNRAEFTYSGPAIGDGPYTIFYHPSKPLTLDKFNSFGHDGQVQSANGSTDHLKYSMKLSGVDTYNSIEFSQEWATAHGDGTFSQNSVLQLLLKLPHIDAEIYSVYVHDAGSFKQTLWFNNGSNVYAALNSADVLKAYMMVPEVNLTGDITVRVETSLGAYEKDFPLAVSNWTGGSQYTIMKKMDDVSVDNTNPMQIHAKSAEDILQFKAGEAAAKARFRAATVTLEQNISFANAGTWSSPISNQYRGLFDGNGKTISGLTSTAALFDRINSGYTVKDFTLDNTCSFSFANASDVKIGAIANFHQGTLSGVTVNANVSLDEFSADALVDLGGLIGRINAAGTVVSNCHFNGMITVPSTYTNSNQYRIGGIVGCITEYNPAPTVSASSFGGVIDCAGNASGTVYSTPRINIGGIVGSNSGTVSNCYTTDASEDDKASVTISKTTYKASILVHPTAMYQCAAIGGIVGYNQAGTTHPGSVENSNNYSTILHVIPSGNAANVYVYAGGVIGQNCAAISGCKNYAKTIHYSTSRYQYLGGIVGYQDSGSISGCTNEIAGEIVDNGACRYPRVGGVIGENTSSSVSGTICNKAPVSFNAMMGGGYGCMVGGVIGHTTQAIDGGDTKTISNSGDITITCDKVSTGSIDHGGVVGRSSSNINGATNSGYIHCTGFSEADGDNAKNSTSNAFLGGILGIADGSITVSNCSNSGKVTFEKKVDKRQDSCPTAVGGIVGRMNAGGTISSCNNTAQALNQNFNNSQTLADGPFCGGIVGVFVGADHTSDGISSVTLNVTTENVSRSKRGYTGGVAGYLSNATINGTSCSGTVYGTNGSTLCAGAVGLMVNSILKNYTFTGNINNGNSSAKMGGLVYNMDGTSEVKDSDFNGKLQYAGGAIVYTATSGAKITNCGIKGSISGTAITAVSRAVVVGLTTSTISDDDIDVHLITP